MVKIYSHSRISTFEQCPLKFKYRYIEKIIPDVEISIETHLGKCVHDTLEWLYREVLVGETPTIDEMITYYAHKWSDEFREGIGIVNCQLNAKDYFNKGINFLIDYYLKHKPFDDGTLELEKKIIIDLDGEGEHKIQGFIDRLVYNKELDRYEVHDYKTANTLPTQEKMDADRQLALYAIAIKELFGQDKEVILVWHYLAHNKKITSERTNEQLEQLKKETLALIKQIENTTHFPSNKGVLCNWCEYKNICPDFNVQRRLREW